MANDREINRVFKTIMKRIRKDNPRMLLIHCLNNFPNRTKGTKLKKIRRSGIISVNNNADIVYTMEKNNFALGSNLCMKDFFFINLKAFKKSKDICIEFLLNF
jgi:hypothetical protein